VPERTLVTPRRSRGRPKREDVAALEKKLLAVALREFVKHGYGGTSLTRIVKAAQVSKTTLYSRFSSKEQLFRAIIEQQIERLAATTTLQADAGRLDLARGLKSYANRALAASLQGDLLEVNRLVYSESRRFPELGAATVEMSELGIRQISEFIRQCAAADNIPCRDPVGVAEVFILMLRGWYVNAMLTNRKVAAARREAWVERAARTLLAAREDW
jgi:AcrR family transcriptional regulator